MAAGYEARARVSADMSPFVAAAREGARAAGTMATAVRELNAELRSTARMSQQAAAGMRPFTQQVGQQAQVQRQAVSSGDDLVRAMREGAMAYDAGTRAAEASAHAARQQEQAQRQAARSSELSASALRSMGREMERLQRQQNTLNQVQRENGRLSDQQASALRAVRARLGALSADYAELTREQRQAVDAARELARAQQAVGAAHASMGRYAREAVAEQQAMDRAARQMESSLWSLRSAVGDAAGAMDQLWNVSSRVTSALWENYSAQEMAIAQISRVSQATALELNQITDSVRQMSEEIPLAFTELGEIAMLGSQVGVSNRALQQFTETVALFAATSEISADETATLMARIMEMTGLPETEVTRLGSAVAYLGSNAAATDKEILTTIESIATMTTQSGMSAEATLGLASAMASLRIRPEIARGASQRVFLQLTEAIQGTSSEMEKMSEITGMSQQAMQEMAESDFDQFFMRVMEGLAGAQASGQSMVPVLRQIGILNSRDAEVVARLAGNYDLLKTQIDGAHASYADGTYLYAESDRIFSTLTARVQILGNTFQNFLFKAAEAVAPFVTRLVDAATATLEFLDSINAAPVVGWGAALLGVAGTLAVVASAVGFAYQGILGFQGLLALWSQRSAMAVASNTALAASNTAVATSSTAVAAAHTRTAATAGTAAVANTGLAASFRATAVAAATFAAANPVTAVITLGAVLVGTAAALDVFGDSAEKAKQELLFAHEAHVTAAGGLDGLKQALDQDTQAWENARAEAASYREQLGQTNSELSAHARDLVEYSAYRVASTQEMSDEDRRAAKEAEALTRSQQALATELGTLGNEAAPAASAVGDLAASERNAASAGADASDSADKVSKSMREISAAADDNVHAVGLATRQWAALSLESAALESGILETSAAFEAFQATGVDLSVALTKELNNAGDGADYLRQVAEQTRKELSGWDSVLYGLNEFTDNMVWDGWRPFASGAEEAADSIDYLADNLEATSLSIEEATRKTELLGNEIIRLPDGTEASTAELMEFSGAGQEAAITAQGLEMEISSLNISVEDLYESFVGFIDPLQAWNDAQQAANDRAAEADEAFAELGRNASVNFQDFLANMEEMSAAQMNWATNLLEIAEVVPPEVLAGLAQMGVEGAGIVQGLADEVNAGNEEAVDRFVDLWAQGGGMASEQFSIMFGDFITQAYEAGDTGGVQFVTELMNKVAEGEISFTEAVDEMTTYAEEEFQNADTTNEPMLENTAALQELTELISRIEKDTSEADSTVTPNLDSAPFWEQIGVWWTNVMLNYGRRYITVTPKFSGGHGRKYADGGWVQGEGGPRDDRVHVMASPNEFIVNARSAAAFAPELEWINSQGSNAGIAGNVPSFVPDNIMSAPSAPLPNTGTLMPSDLAAAMRTNSVSAGPRTVINIVNHYPQAEPTSVTANRSLQYAAALDGLG